MSAVGFTYARMISELAEKHPEATALVLNDSSSTFADLHTRGTRLAHVLRDRGVGPGDRVGFLGKNSFAFFELAMACSLLEAILVSLNWRLSPAELGVIVEDAEASLVVADPEHVALLHRARGPKGALPCIAIGAELDGLIATAERKPIASSTRPESVLLLLYSSGTTGRPKGVLITNANLEFTRLSGRLLYGMSEHSVNLVPSPFFHIGGAGYGLTALSQGGKTVLVSDSRPATLLRAIEQHRVTHAFLVPTLVQDLLRAPEIADADLSSLRLVAYGGAPMAEALSLKAMARLKCAFLGVYGMTETSGTVVALAPKDHDPGGPRARLLRSIGKPLPWAAEVQLRDPSTGKPVSAGEVGEIWVRSGQVTPGYWRQPEATAQALTPDGWLRTGDAGYQDADGYFFLHDRLKDMVISGGENVYPVEVEHVLAHHPAVLEVAVIGVPSERWGETVKAVVVANPQVAVVTESELIAFTRERLAHYKCPTSVDFVQSLPRTATGKLMKHVLRARYSGKVEAENKQ